tara:strand:+ start:5261 stop:5482 length:222 start_codon:yes stop_codon:yes gene_type:complete
METIEKLLDRGWTRVAIANYKHIRISRPTLNRYISGENPIPPGIQFVLDFMLENEPVPPKNKLGRKPKRIKND